jgi:ElaB/YqjD/DUF883 family membrane-anchored ribosome-binding protein
MATTPTDVTKERLLDEFSAVIGETEQLLRSVAGAGTDKASALKASVQQGLADATQRVAAIRAAAANQASAAVGAVDDYVEDNPWRAVGITAVCAATAGLVVGLLLARRSGP